MILSAIIALSQLIDTYIRWLAFRDRLQPEQNNKLWCEYVLWAIASIFFYDFLFGMVGINAASYKSVVMPGWLPYFLISLNYSRLIHQIFILGMEIIMSLIQHTLSMILVLENFAGKSISELIILEAVSYLLLFLIFIPLSRKYFMNLLSSGEIFELRPIGLYLAIFPLVIVSGHLIRLADGVLIHSWEERLSRIYLPLLFLFFYRYILDSTKKYLEKRWLKRNKTRLEEQLKTLIKYNDIMEENYQQITVMRHDLRHNYSIILSLLEDNDAEAALKHIKRQKKLLELENK
ncbi:MAG: hypothetical protein IKZ53_07705 [Selenomonadaceae bacterium]|nr:hypothetical protein [Selenomonadaceae bacterium]